MNKINNNNETILLYIQQLLYENKIWFISESGEEIALPESISQLLKESLFHLVKSRHIFIVPAFDWITASDAAEILSVSIPTVNKFVRENKIATFEVSSGTVVRKKLKLKDVLYLKTILQSV